MTNILPLGSFVIVSDSIGVIVGLPGELKIPGDHYAVWYGEQAANDGKIPLARTVPIVYCMPLDRFETYH